MKNRTTEHLLIAIGFIFLLIGMAHAQTHTFEEAVREAFRTRYANMPGFNGRVVVNVMKRTPTEGDSGKERGEEEVATHLLTPHPSPLTPLFPNPQSPIPNPSLSRTISAVAAQAISASPAGGNALALDGVDDFAQTPSGFTIQRSFFDNLTVETWAWFNRLPETVGDISITTLIRKFPEYSLFILEGQPPGTPQRTTSIGFEYVTVDEFGEITFSVNLAFVVASLDEWVHIAVSHDVGSGQVYLAWDGEVFSDVDQGDPLIPLDEPLTIGGPDDLLDFDHYVDGFMDEVRISKTVRYRSDFRPPVGEFSLDVDTVALYHFNAPVGAFEFTDASNRAGTAVGLNGARTDTPATVEPDPGMDNGGQGVFPISFRQSIDGVLGPGDDQLDDGSYVDLYSFEGIAGQTVIISMVSNEIDSFLLLLSPSTEEIVAGDDDSGEGFNAEIVFTLPTDDTYGIMALSAFPVETGAYTLRLDQKASVPTEEAILSVSSDALVRVNEPFIVDIAIEDVTDLAGWELEIHFDPKILMATEVIEGDFLQTSGDGSFFQAGDIDNRLGVTSGVSAAFLGRGGVSGAGVILTLAFTALAEGHTPVEIHNSRLGTPDSEPIAHRTIVAQITVEASFPPWDVNQDGTVNIFDLIGVAQHFGMPAPVDDPRVDVTQDGLVNIFDLIAVAQHIGESTLPGAPSVTQGLDIEHIGRLEAWIQTAQLADDGSETYRRGIVALENLLRAIIPEETAVLPNYPNPFNPETWMPYQLSKASDVTVTIFDTNGKMIRRLDQGVKPAGTYRNKSQAVYWNGRSETGEPVSSGVYFYVLRAGDYNLARKMVIVK